MPGKDQFLRRKAFLCFLNSACSRWFDHMRGEQQIPSGASRCTCRTRRVKPHNSTIYHRADVLSIFSNDRWRARAAAAVASRERKERLAAEQAMAASSSAAALDGVVAAVGADGAARQVGLAGSAVEGDEGAWRYQDAKGAAAGSAATILAPSAEYEGIYGGGGGGGFSGGGYVGGQFAGGTTVGADSGGYSTSAALTASAAAAAVEAATQQQAIEAENAAQRMIVVGVEQRNHDVRLRASTMPVTSATEEAAVVGTTGHQQSPGSRATVGAAAATAAAAAATATTAATAAATAAAEADDAARRSWEAQEQQLQLSRLAAERSELERRVADAENAAVNAAAVGQGVMCQTAATCVWLSGLVALCMQCVDSLCLYCNNRPSQIWIVRPMQN